MGGGLMQLVAYGAQDIYLTGNPQITFFKVVYRRHTNFSMETIEQTISGASTTAGTSGTVTISRNGDLVSSVYVTSSTAGISHGSAIVSEVDVEIGGQLIDRHYEEWNDVWNELSTPASKAVGLKSMICDVGKTGGSGDRAGVSMVQVPLNFWFCRNPGLALPLIALQYHEVKLKFTWGAKTAVGSGTSGAGIEATCQVWCDYIYLDTDERRRFAQVSHEYLIEQIQKQSATATLSTKLNFNHPVKELIWTSAATNAYTTAQLKLNGHDRFSAQEEEYFQLRQPYQYHTSVPQQNLPGAAAALLGVPFVNLFSGGNKDHVPIEAMAFANDVVTSGDVMVQQGGTGEPLADITPAVTDGAAETALTIVYSFLRTDIKAPLPVAGDEVLITGDGTQAISNADGTSATVHTHVTRVQLGDLGDSSGAGAGSFSMQFDEELLEHTVGAAVINAEDFTITDFRIRHGGGTSACLAATSKMTKKINVYSFALKPEEHQPSGTCNFSRIDNAKLDTGAALEAADNIYAVNYNVLRIMSGMGGLASSN
jgi:hypothetical protein